ncbi:MAG: tetratricopeptide repeat protein, partial [Deltaproteobacteria bacterium]
GVAHFSMGQFDKAVELINRALTYNPKTHKILGILASAYAYLGHEKEARDSLQDYLRGFEARPNLNGIMSEWPFKDPKDADLLAEGLIKAGLPGRASDYCKVLLENKLSGGEIRKLLFGHTMEGLVYGREDNKWSLYRTKDGAVEYMDTIRYDTGKSWIEGDSLFTKYRNLYEGLKITSEVYRNPDGTSKKMDEYFIVWDWGITPFSVKN